eukprot:TRINITY_DN12018_c0_g1_i1.p1 TRINITY_DN12018_c0_g1~~TRINITY_DN12018_c0_g1_i1.p1  ORF type:complete len:241 (-),score=26.93 TRINITY_DN12018_c0_g1_i1:52-774(-)
MELAEHGDLERYMGDNGRMSDVEARYAFKQIVHGLEYIHSANIRHRDPKLSNLLISSVDPGRFLDIKITDFGLAKRIRDGFNRAESNAGTKHFRAPEVVSAGYSQTGFQDQLISIWRANKKTYTITMDTDGQYMFQQETLQGTLYWQSEWLVAKLQSGTIRLRAGTKPRTIMSNFKPPGSAKWNLPITAACLFGERKPQPGEYSTVLNKTLESSSLGIDVQMDGVAILVRGLVLAVHLQM